MDVHFCLEAVEEAIANCGTPEIMSTDFKFNTCFRGDKYMSRAVLTMILVTNLAGCITAPVPSEHYPSKCGISSERLTLKIVDVAKGTNSDSVEGYLISPILVPVTAVPSGAIVLLNNIYNFVEENVLCG